MHPASLLLPAQPTPLVDRAVELATIRQRLADDRVRLLTLVGPAGVGKTRLALAAVALLAEQSTTRFPDGVTLVDLAPVRDPALVLHAMGRALGLTDTGHPPLPERLRDVLHERAALLVLDNCEQVLPASAVGLADLLARCPGLVLLVTSRVPLQLRWERTLRVAPLPVPTLTAALPPLDALAQVPSVALFVARARARRADFALTAAQAPLVAELVVQLDGLPLALELAAARLDVLSLPMIVHRLADRLRLLRWEAPDVPERQQSLEAAVGWSYDLLDEDERRLFRCLGVFVGRVTLDAIAAVVSDGAGAGDTGGEADAGATLQRLASLAEKSLILPGRQIWYSAQGEGVEEAEEDDPEPAFGMLEMVREYAQEQLAAQGELTAARRAHAHYFLALAERADPHLRQHGQRAWFLRLEREHDNLRAALRWLLDQDASEEREAALRLAGALGWFWFVRGYHTEGWRWLEEALARVPAGEGADGADPAVRTRALVAAGALLAVQGEFARARAVLEEALSLAEERQDPAAVATVLRYLGLCVAFAGEAAEGTQLLDEALRRWEALGDAHGLGVTLSYLGYATDAMGDVAAAAAHYTDALRRLGAVGDAEHEGFVQCYLGVSEWKRGDHRSAVDHVRAGVQTSVTLRDRWLLSVGAQATVALVGARAEPARRARLLGAMDALAQATGATLVWERLPPGHDVVGLREQLTQEGWGAAYREGRALAFGDVAALALSLLEEVAQTLPHPEEAPEDSTKQTEPPSQPSRHSERNPLTEREREVLRLVADGLSSKAIGQQLFLSPSTINQHLTSMYTKLGVSTRAQAVAVAAQRGLL